VILAALWALGGCGQERPAPCNANNCGTVMDRDVFTIYPDLPVAPGPDVVTPAIDAAAPQDLPALDIPSPDVPSLDVPSPDVSLDVADDIPRDPPTTRTRDDLGTRGLVASLPCGDVLPLLDVTVIRRTVPANSFQLQVRNASPTDTISIWYDATLNTVWNIENLVSDLAPNTTVTLDFWRSTGSPAWYVLGIARAQHYYVNASGVFVELPCGRAARVATTRFRETIAP